MLITKFEKQYHDEYGFYGWTMKGAPSTFTPATGMGVAHDILEHRRGDDGSVVAEFQALGAMLYVRGESGYWQRQGNVNPPGAHLGADLGYTLGIQYSGVSDGITDPGVTQKLEPHVEEWIAHALRDGRKSLKDHSDSFTSQQVDEYLTRSVGWIRKGYRAARKRFKGTCPSTLEYLFSKIEKEADRLIKNEMADYSQLVVRVDVSRCYVDVHLEEDFN